MRNALLLNDTTREIGHIGCFLTIQNINKACRESGINIVDYDPVINGSFDESAFRDRLTKCDLVLVNGEGSLHHNAASTLFNKCEIAKKTGKKIFLINSVWQANTKTRSFLDLFSLIFVRESLSLQELRRDGYNQCSVVPDMVFYAPPTQPPLNTKDIDGLIIDSVIPDVTLTLAKLALTKNLPMQFMGRWHKRQFLRQHPFTFMLLQLAKGPPPSLLNNPDVVANSQFLITGRYHGACLAMIYGVPFIAIASNTHKIEGLLADSRLDPTVHSVGNRNLSPAAINTTLDQLRSIDRKKFQESTAIYVRSARTSIQRMFHAIAEN